MYATESRRKATILHANVHSWNLPCGCNALKRSLASFSQPLRGQRAAFFQSAINVAEALVVVRSRPKISGSGFGHASSESLMRTSGEIGSDIVAASICHQHRPLSRWPPRCFGGRALPVPAVPEASLFEKSVATREFISSEASTTFENTT
jgi:hypothetical protein